MYSDRDGGEITLWCDGRKNFATSEQIKRKQEVTTKRQEKEEEVDHIFSQLKDKQGDKYDRPKLRLWARMIASGLHESTDDPPDVPAFHQGEPKRKKESLTGALTGAVEAFARAMGNTPKSQEVVQRGQVSPSDIPKNAWFLNH